MLKVFWRQEVKCPHSGQLTRKAALAAARAVKKTRGEVEIVAVGEKKIRALNRVYRGCDRVTDVLSFDLRGDKTPRDLNGQIFVCYAQIARQAERYGVKVKEEFVRMIVHGVLHLAGFEHQTKARAAAMFKQQEKIVSSILKR